MTAIRPEQILYGHLDRVEIDFSQRLRTVTLASGAKETYDQYEQIVEVWLPAGVSYILDGPDRENETEVRADGQSAILRVEENQLHSEIGPALEFERGAKIWYKHGRKHRLIGPAVIRGEDKEYWIHDVMYSEEQWKVEVLHHLSEQAHIW